MTAHKMKFVVVNNMAPRNHSVCAACSRPLERGYLHDLSTSKRYCGVGCYPRWMVVSGFVGSIAPTNPFELAIAWPRLTIDVASALFDSAWSDQGGWCLRRIPSDSARIWNAAAPQRDANSARSNFDGTEWHVRTKCDAAALIDMHGERTRLWITAERAVEHADHDPRLIDQATETLENVRRKEGMPD
jgi:hypothetical protein